MTYTLRRATSTDEATVTDLIADRAAWLASRGVDQWGIKDPARTTAASVAAGETWLLVDDGDGTAVGTLTMNTRPDRDFWHDHVPALYLSKLATRVDQAGNGLGTLLLHAAYLYGRWRQIQLLRWDVWRTNTQLQEYYLDLGAQMVDVVEVAGRNSGALFEFRNGSHTAADVYRSEQLLTIASRYGGVVQLAFESLVSPTRPYTTTLAGSPGEFEGSGTSTNQAYLLPDLLDGAGRPYLLDPKPGDPEVLHHDGDRWRVRTELVAGDVLRELRPGWPYWLTTHALHNGQRFVLIRGDLDAGQVDQTPEAPAVVDLTYSPGC